MEGTGPEVRSEMVGKHMFSLGDPMSNVAFRGKFESFDIGADAQRGNPASAPLTINRAEGRKLMDFIWTGCLAPLISMRVVSILEDAGLTGWSTYPVEVFGRKQEPIPGYLGFAVIGRCKWIGYDKREEALVYRSNASGTLSRYFVGLRFDEASWDGSDFFMDTEGKGHVLVSERARDVFTAARVSNCEFTPIDEMELLATQRDIIPKTVT